MRFVRGVNNAKGITRLAKLPSPCGLFFLGEKSNAEARKRAVLDGEALGCFGGEDPIFSRFRDKEPRRDVFPSFAMRRGQAGRWQRAR